MHISCCIGFDLFVVVDIRKNYTHEMQDFLLNIDNKEILIEILHHSIDYLIGNRNDQHTLRLCHKYGFHSPDDFMLTTRTIARCYRNACLEGVPEAELLSEFANLSPELQKLTKTVLEARRPEIMKHLVRRHNAQENPLVESFDWDLRLIMGDSSFPQNHRMLTTLTFNCRDAAGKDSSLHFQMNREMLDAAIAALEAAVEGKTCTEPLASAHGAT